jgi:hypothetical protein
MSLPVWLVRDDSDVKLVKRLKNSLE